MPTSKCINKCDLFSAVLVQMLYKKYDGIFVIKFIYKFGYLYNRPCKSKRLIYKGGYLYSRPRKSKRLIYKGSYLYSRLRKSKHLIYKGSYLYSRPCKSKRLIYECGFINSHLLKTFLTLILKCATYILILSFLSRFVSLMCFLH